MATLLDTRTETYQALEEAQKHNALINERYRRLQNAEADQFSAPTTERNETAYAVRASVLAPERPAVSETPLVEQTPQVTEYVRSRIETPVFTTEKFDVAERQETLASTYAPTPVAIATPVEIQAPAKAAAAMTEAQYSLSHMAKMVLAAFVAVVTVMLALICVNTQLIEQRATRIRSLEERRAELVTEYAELQRAIEIAKSEDTVRDYAQGQGMIQLGE